MFDQRERAVDRGDTPTSGAYAIRREIARAAMPRLRKELDRLGLQRVGLKADSIYKNRQGAFMIDGYGVMDILVGASIDPDKTLYHEAIHAMRQLDVFTQKEWQTLEAEARTTWMDQYDIRPNTRISSSASRLRKPSRKPLPSMRLPRRRQRTQGGALFRRINDIIKAIRKAFGGKTAKDIFDEAYAGRHRRARRWQQRDCSVVGEAAVRWAAIPNRRYLCLGHSKGHDRSWSLSGGRPSRNRVVPRR